MKNILLVLLFFLAAPLLAQDEQSNTNIAVSVVFTDQSENLTLSLQEKIRNKVAQILSRNGVAAEGWAQEFVVYPKINVFEEQRVSGMQNKLFVKAEFSLYMKQMSNDLLFASLSETITGSGRDKNAALSKAIGSIRTDKKSFQDFVEKGKSRILEYYAKNCNQILTQARTYRQQQDYGGAMEQLFQVPVQAESCYANAQKEMETIYLEWQKNHCKRGIQGAKTAIAAQNWNLALEYLTIVDPASPCFDEAEELVKKIEGKVDAEAQRNWNLLMKIYDDSVELEKYRMNTAVQIARAYASKRPDNLYYNLIVK